MGSEHEHDIDCGQALERMYLFLDNEMQDADCARIRQHLADCEPCLEQYDMEGLVKSLVQRSCCSDKAPEELRQKVMARIAQVRTEIQTTPNL